MITKQIISASEEDRGRGLIGYLRDENNVIIATIWSHTIFMNVPCHLSIYDMEEIINAQKEFQNERI